MAKISIGSQTLEFEPTWENYQIEVFPIGISRRSLDGTLHFSFRGRKHRWIITLLVQHDWDWIPSYLDGFQTEFVDVDGASYTVILTAAIPVRGYPVKTIGEMTLTLEEV